MLSASFIEFSAGFSNILHATFQTINKVDHTRGFACVKCIIAKIGPRSNLPLLDICDSTLIKFCDSDKQEKGNKVPQK